MAMLETTVRDDFQDGVYMLTVFDDKTMSGREIYVNSDDSTELLIANINRTLIATNGSATVDLVGINAMQYSALLGNRYKVSSRTSPVALDITARIQQNRVQSNGWNVGQSSKRAIMFTWEYEQHIDHGEELLAIQVCAVLVSCVFVSGDFYLTVQGLQGFLQHKPVMTYDLAAGMERRKLILLWWSVCHVVSLIYPDILRAYFKATIGLWCVVAILVAGFFTCSTFVAISLIQYIPSPFTHVVTLSSVIMGQITFLIAPLWVIQSSAITQEYHDAPISLGLNISGVVHSSGAFANGGFAKSSMNFMLPTTLAVWVIGVLVSVLVPQINRKRHKGTFLLNLAWTRTNGFLDKCGMPNWITGLPLDKHKMIKIGNKLFCKPSTQATLGIATVVPREEPRDGLQNPHEDQEDKKMTLVSVYCVLPIVWSIHRWLPQLLRPKVVGTVHKNEFTPGLGHAIEPHDYTHNRGSCSS
ncbi:unnamed protein product [Aphanomyces euteiches]